MIHKMKLQSKYFDFMLRGTKRIEIRLNDEKRQLIKIGDIIEFERFSELNDSFKTRVVELIKYNNFDELVKDFDISILADKSMTKYELINELTQFYPEEKQQKYGVLAIRIELIWLYKKEEYFDVNPNCNAFFSKKFIFNAIYGLILSNIC